MKAWLITVGEPLPLDPGGPRLMRAGILAQVLRSRGHEVTWWTSTFDHFRKLNRFAADTERLLPDGTRLVLLHGRDYRSNVSLARIVNHVQLARSFTRLAARETAPDVIVCSFPPIELSRAATDYGSRRGVPVMLDIRDLWPDIFLELVPRAARLFARLALAPMFGDARRACRAAAAIIGITPAFVAWGLARAGRAAGDLDRDFPHGYVDSEPSPDEIAMARNRWRNRGLVDGDFIACFFGTIGRQFELETVARAAGQLRTQHPDIKFVLCGGGDRLQHYRGLAAGLPNVMFPGWVGCADIWTLMRIAAVGLAPYINEASFTQSIPNKAIEYLSAGLPVISSLRGVFEQMLQRYNCGLCYPNHDVNGLAAALVRLRDNHGEREVMAGNALSLYREQFVAEKVYGNLVDHLARAIAARTSGRQ